MMEKEMPQKVEADKVVVQLTCPSCSKEFKAELTGVQKVGTPAVAMMVSI